MAEERSRLYLWDNMKALLIFFVVLGHFTSQIPNAPWPVVSLYTFMNWFHMPMFLFTSGLFSKSAIKGDKLQLNRVFGYLILYVSLRLIIWLGAVCFGHMESLSILSTNNIPWYMFVMAASLCLTYLLRNVKPHLLLPATVLVSLAFGYTGIDTDVLCISRVIVYFPVFLLGYYADGAKLAAVTRKPWLRIAAGLVLVGFGVLCCTNLEFLYSMRPVWIGRIPYSGFPYPAFGPLLRLFHYAGAGVISFAVLCVLPNRKTVFSYIGAATLPIYFLHRPILHILTDTGFCRWLVASLGWTGILLFLLMAVALTLLLSFKPLSVPFHKLMHCRYDFLFRNRQQE